MLDRLYNTYVAKGIPVYLGEYGCVHRTNAKAEEFRKYYLEYTIKAMRDRHIPPSSGTTPSERLTSKVSDSSTTLPASISTMPRKS